VEMGLGQMTLGQNQMTQVQEIQEDHHKMKMNIKNYLKKLKKN
jgi:hypothetical protein